MRQIEETCRYCYWSATSKDGESVCNKKLGITGESISVDSNDTCKEWLGDLAQ